LSPQEGKPDPLVLLTHKNDWAKTLRVLVHIHLKGASRIRKDPAVLDRVEALVGANADDESITEPLIAMQCPRSQNHYSNQPPSRRTYYKLDWNAKLSSVLRNKAYVEFPVIEILEESCFDGILLDEEGNKTSIETTRKRRKLNSAAGKKAIVGLIGEYGSDGDEGEDDDNALDELGDYVDAESIEGEGSGHSEDDAEGDLGETELVSQSYLDGNIHGGYTRDDNEDPELDWGDMDDELAEDEAKLASLEVSIRQKSAT